MTRIPVRTKMGIGALLAAGVVGAAGTGYACVTYKGDMTFTNASGSQTVTGDAFLVGGHSWCGGEPPFVLSAPANFSLSLLRPASTGSCRMSPIDRSNTIIQAKP